MFLMLLFVLAVFLVRWNHFRGVRHRTLRACVRDFGACAANDALCQVVNTTNTVFADRSLSPSSLGKVPCVSVAFADH